MSSHYDIRISKIGTYIPERRVSNVDFLPTFGLNEDFLRTKLGIMTRAVKDPEEDTSDLCVKAFADLCAQTNIAPSDVQICCVVTQNPDVSIPHTAAIVHQKLGLGKACMTFDISQGCAGYVHGLALLTSLMTCLGLSHALLFTCDPYSKIVNPQDKNTALIFGDAASVTYLTPGTPGFVLVDASFGTEPGSTSCLYLNDAQLKGDAAPCLQMDGTTVLFHATRVVPASIRALLGKHGKSVDEIDSFVLHPGSKRVVDLIKKDLKVPGEKVPFEIEQYGNTVSSSIPLMMKNYIEGRKRGPLVLSGFGVGFSWGTCLLEFRD